MADGHVRLDIRCVRLTPYKVGERLLLDVQQVIPLPEASELTIQLQRKATQERAARGGDGRDWTQYVITTADGSSGPLRERRAVLAMIRALHAAGVPAKELADVIPHVKYLSVDGTLTGEDLAEAFGHAYAKAAPERWFLDSPVHDDGQTWVMTKMWGTDTELVLQRLAGLTPPGSGDRLRTGPVSPRPGMRATYVLASLRTGQVADAFMEGYLKLSS